MVLRESLDDAIPHWTAHRGKSWATNVTRESKDCSHEQSAGRVCLHANGALEFYATIHAFHRPNLSNDD